MKEIASIIQDRLTGDPSENIIRYQGKWYTREWLKNAVERFTDTINGVDIPSDASIGLIVQSRPDLLAALLSLIANERRITMIYSYMSGAALADKLAQIRSPAVIAAKEQWDEHTLGASQELGSCAIASEIGNAEITVLSQYQTHQADEFRRHSEAPGIEMLTSGTTGPPKHIPLSYNKIFGRMVKSGFVRTDHHLPALLHSPIGNVAGLYGFVSAFTAGSPIILLDRFRVEDWLAYVDEYAPAHVSIPVAGLRMILDADVAAERLKSLRFIATGAATLSRKLRLEFEARYGISILQAYGATEFGGVVTAMTPSDIKEFGSQKSDSVGRPLGDIQLRITDTDSGREQEVGKKGRLEVFSPTISPEWIVTTDCAMIDQDGFLYHCGRLDGAIMRGGFKIIPDQLVEVLSSHPSINSAAIVGLEDERLGEIPVAAFETSKDAQVPSPESLSLHMRERLPATMIPSQFLHVGQLPRTPSMKIDLGAVRKLFVTDHN